jgi:hypothetical protein
MSTCEGISILRKAVGNLRIIFAADISAKWLNLSPLDLYDRLLVCFRVIEDALFASPAEIGDDDCHAIDIFSGPAMTT